jgi:soluble lytic murein transglycosylase-like protein
LVDRGSARFDDGRVFGLDGHDRSKLLPMIGLALGLACASSKPVVQPPVAHTSQPSTPADPPGESIDSEAMPEPVALAPMPVGEPAPWLDDAELLARILAVQTIVETAAATRNVEPALINGLIYVESKFEPKAKGGDAQGLMQLMPKTAASLAKQLERKRESYDPDFNIHAGTLLIAKLLERFDGDVSLALAAYNRGSGVVAGWIRDGEPMPERTRNYVDRVLRARKWFLESPPLAK